MDRRKFIETIRADFSDMKEKPRGTLERAIEELSVGLYAKDFHFIFELLQNADDNEYFTAQPQMAFLLTRLELEGEEKMVLVVSNNERGFNEKQVDAVCDVCKSTKSKANGYIGEKGIGFKSVFKVTTCPYIFSNGYQFALPENDEETGLGYVVPRWVEDCPPGLDTTYTNIVLPLDKPEFDVTSIVKSLMDIAPETILFLNKLQSVDITVNLDKNYKLKIVRYDTDSPLVRLESSSFVGNEVANRIATYWKIKKAFERPAEVTHKKREGIDSREVAIAIPMDESSKTTGKLFAYLPVWQETEMPFLVNGDFILVSSREGIKEDEPWNLWLRDCIAETYTDAFISCLNDAKLPIECKCAAYSSIPEKTNHSFLSPIIAEIHQSLRKNKCVMTEPEFGLSLPEHCHLPTAEFRKVFCDGSLPTVLLTEKFVVSAALVHCHEKLEKIGARSFFVDQILECLRDQEWLTSKPIPWFVQLHRYLKKNNFDGRKDVLLSLKIVPVENHESTTKLASSSDKTIFYAASASGATDANENVEYPSWFADAIFLDTEFLQEVGGAPDCTELEKWLLNDLGLQEYSTSSRCRILLDYAIKKHDEIAPEELLDITRFLARFAANDFRWCYMPLLMSDGTVLSMEAAGSKVVIAPENYRPRDGWQNIWVEPSERTGFLVLANAYTGMEKFPFSLLGLKDFPPWKSRRYKSIAACENEIEKKHFKYCHDNNPGGAVELISWQLPQSISTKSELALTALLTWLGSILTPGFHLDSARLFGLGLMMQGKYGSHTKYFDSPLLSAIKNESWLPTDKGRKAPREVFANKQEIREILGGTVAYFQGTPNDSLFRFLGVRTELTIAELLNILEDNSIRHGYNLDLARRIYKTIASRIDEEDRVTCSDIVNRFKRLPLILVPDRGGRSGWYKSGDCLWKERGELGCVGLESTYPDLQGFFIKAIGVAEDASDKSCADRWLWLQDNVHADADEARQAMDTIYKRLLSFLKQSPSVQDCEWWRNFVPHAKIYTQGNTFEPKETVFVPDSGELKRIFSRSEGLHFAWQPDTNSFSHWQPLYEKLGVKQLSDVVQTTFAGEQGGPEGAESRYLTKHAVAMIATWIRERDEQAYKSLWDEGTIKSLMNLSECRPNGPIIVKFMISIGMIMLERSEPYPAFLTYTNNGHLLLLGDDIENELKFHIAERVASVLVGNRARKDLATWIELVLEANDLSRVQRHGWSVPKEVRSLLSQMTRNTAKDPIIPPEITEASEPLVDSTIEVQVEIPGEVQPPSKDTPPQDVIDNNLPFSAGKIKPVFPVVPVKNKERRGERVADEYNKAPSKQYEVRERSVRISKPDIDPRVWLRSLYENDSGELICQICQNEMPFRGRDGTHYFEAVEIFPKEWVPKESIPQFLALCPLCAAKYQEFIKRDEIVVKDLHSRLIQEETERLEFPICLGREMPTLRFVEAHLFDLLHSVLSFDDLPA